MAEIRTMTQDDLDFAVQITHQEGWGYNKEDLDRLIQWSPEGCFVLWDGQRRIGMATTVFYGTFGWVGNVVVDKDHRGLGHGKAIMGHCTAHLLERGARGARLFAYDNTRAFYEGMGFRHEGPVRVFRRDPGPGERPALKPEFAIKVLDHAHLDHAIGLDKLAFAGDRSTLLRAIWGGNPGLCLGLWREDELRGVLFGKKVLGNIEVGPWVCDLPDIRPALALMDVLLSMVACSVFTAVHEAQTTVLQALDRSGFKQIDRVFGMSIGDVPGQRVEDLLSVGALEKG